MIEPWGRSPAAGTWPHRTPVWTLAARLLALAGVAVYRYHAVWTPLQQMAAGLRADPPAMCVHGRRRCDHGGTVPAAGSGHVSETRRGSGLDRLAE
jgi:hypothetical protein